MVQRLSSGAAVLLLALSGAAAWAAAPVREGVVQVASNRAEQYERGFSDGLNGRDERERDKDWRAGHAAGVAQHKANEARSDGRDYARGYRDGFNGSRERKAADGKSRAYAAGYSSGQAQQSRLAGAPAAALPGASRERPASVDKLAGRRAADVDGDMKALGYQRMGQFKGDGGESFSTWQSRAANSCVRLRVRKDRVQDFTTLDNDRCQ